MISIIEKNKYYFILLSVFLVTAFFSTGFFHPDEHYSVLELLNLKREHFQDPSILYWDYQSRIRSWFQPALYYFLFFPALTKSGFLLATMIRIFQGVLASLSIYFFLKLYESEIKKNLILLVSFCWFIPFMLVRTSSESLSTSLFLLAFYFYSKRYTWASGLLFGFAFLARFQLGIMIGFLILFDLFKKDLDIKKFSQIMLTIFIAIGAGVLIDRWGYCEWIFTPYQYFKYNLLLDKASEFGTSPFYYYLHASFMAGIPFVSAFVVFYASKFLKQNKTSNIFWSSVFFVLTHSMIAHKEVRFLTTSFVIFALLAFIQFSKIENYSKLIAKILITLNILVMLKTSLGTSTSYIALMEGLQQNAVDKVYVPSQSKKFEFKMPFYLDRKIETEYLPAQELRPTEYFLLINKLSDYLARDKNCTEEIYRQYPDWVMNVNFFNWLSRSSFTVVLKCKK